MLKVLKTASCIALAALLVGPVFTGSAQSQDYTTQRTQARDQIKDVRDKSTKKNRSSRPDDKTHRKLGPCTDDDQRAIQKFDRKANRVIRKQQEMQEESADVKTAEQSIEFSQKYKDVTNFHNTPEYKQMTKVYKRCHKKIPTFQNARMFWMPNRDE